MSCIGLDFPVFFGKITHMFEITGMISIISDTQTFGKKFTKREFILDVRAGDNLNRIKFECHLQDIKLLDDYEVGDIVEVEFGLKGNEWKGKFFTNLVAYGISAKDFGKTNGDGDLEDSNVADMEKEKTVGEEVPF